MDIINRIKSLRIERGYSQEYMAQKLGIAHNNYGKIERGITQLTYTRIQEIARILDVSVNKILGTDLPISQEEHEAVRNELKDVRMRVEQLEVINAMLKQNIYISFKFDFWADPWVIKLSQFGKRAYNDFFSDVNKEVFKLIGKSTKDDIENISTENLERLMRFAESFLFNSVGRPKILGNDILIKYYGFTEIDKEQWKKDFKNFLINLPN